MKRIITIGQKFGLLTTVQEIESIKYGGKKYRRFSVNCECGNNKNILLDHLLSGKIKSCGCQKVERAKQLNKTHGLTKHPLYSVWAGMKRRCYNPNEEKYYRYGGRGIKVCNKWLNDFKAFYDWAIDAGYKKDLQIDRINNDGNYEPVNCQWATNQNNTQHTSRIKLKSEDALDIRNTKLLFGKDITNKEIGFAYGINENTVAQVLKNQTWQNI